MFFQYVHCSGLFCGCSTQKEGSLLFHCSAGAFSKNIFDCYPQQGITKWDINFECIIGQKKILYGSYSASNAKTSDFFNSILILKKIHLKTCKK